MKRLNLFVLALMLALPAAHAATLYEIEVVVFENLLPDLEAGELWTQAPGTNPVPGLADARPMDDAAPTDGGSLGAAAAALIQNGNYRVLLHRRWRQSAEEKSATRLLRLRDPAGQVDGSFRFYLSRHLYADVDLVLNPADGPAFRLTEHRRVKPQETHYFDHPKLGALVKIGTVSN